MKEETLLAIRLSFGDNGLCQRLFSTVETQ